MEIFQILICFIDGSITHVLLYDFSLTWAKLRIKGRVCRPITEEPHCRENLRESILFEPSWSKDLILKQCEKMEKMFENDWVNLFPP
jgi:hypothetical protein